MKLISNSLHMSQCVSVSVCQCLSVSVSQCVSVSVCQCKAQRGIVKHREALQLPSDLELGVMEARLQIPSTPLRECLSKIHVESCLARIQSGLRLYRGFLPVVQDHVEPAQRRHVETLSHDAKDLLKQIHRQMLSLELPLVSYPDEEGGPSSHQPFLGGVSGESERRVGSYILLRNFERFVLSVYRALRSLKRH
ncbi:UNVERIFIED_CONTAM: hypothetical protein FKN15_052612 [Acipenser sinensis]